MKKITLILTVQFLFSGLLLSDTGWVIQVSGTTDPLHSVFFNGPSTGWAVGLNKILKTTNGGQSWISQEFPFGENDNYIFNSVCFTNTLTGWVVGELFKDPPGLQYRVILRTTNAGAEWTLHHTSGSFGLNSICFRESDCGWTVGPNLILRTTNEGINWAEQDFPTGENDDFTFNSTCFINSETGWIAGTLFRNPPGIHFQVIFSTTNGGINWSQNYFLDDAGLSSINFIDVTIGWSAGGGSILSTSNSGTDWSLQAYLGSENCSYNLRAIYFTDPMHGWATGGSVCTPGSGNSRVILRTSNGGNNWSEQTIPVTGNNYILNSVFFINENTGWIVGDGGIIMKTINGGLTSIESNNTSIPDSYKLYQNYPNPFNPRTNFKIQIAPLSADYKLENVKLVINDVLGREVAMLINEKLNIGVYEVEFDGSMFASGLYFYSLVVGDDIIDTKKMLLLK